jgi:demethylmenaquinone methyltransferase/2-methoxy-6-polyprenyl-1,4-benzoquinol methylase
MTGPRPDVAIECYRRHAAGYDASALRTMPLRRRVVGLLRLRPGDAVLDVACGTGLSFPLIQEAIGPGGRLLGVEASPEMMARARERVEQAGWGNVTLVEAPMEQARPPFPLDAILFNYTHDVLRSPLALLGIFSAARPGARVAAAGMKLFPWWLAPLNLYALAKARPYMTTFEGLARPWDLLAQYVPGLAVTPTQLGMGYLAHGTCPGAIHRQLT